MALERKVRAMYSLWREGPSGSKRIKTEKEKVVWPGIQKSRIIQRGPLVVDAGGRRAGGEGVQKSLWSTGSQRVEREVGW